MSSTTIDERIVEMRFDNKQFESNVQTSLSTLAKLKQSLNLTEASKGLESISTAVRNFSFAGLGAGIDVVQTKFSYLQATIQHQLNNIVDSAISAGRRMVSALTVDPIKTGLAEYETQINAIQTILANTQSKGTTLDDVNAALDMLNAYADKTIYNFTEMTRNIGTFTAAGVDLETSVNAIQGIANLAAVSGSTSQQASTAMYQLSQALASGTVKLMDWNSVVNAGMGGQVFQDALKETARVHGVAIDSMIEKQGSFRETLSEGWLTSEILTETLQKFTLTTEGLTDAQVEQNREMLRAKGYTEAQIDAIFDLGDTATQAATKVKTLTQLWDTTKEAAQSGWTQTWELIVGDFEEAKALWSSVADILGEIINTSAEARNTMLAGALNSNWEKMTAQITEAGYSMGDFEIKVKETMEAHKLDVVALIKEHGSLSEVFKSGAASSDILKESIRALSGGLSNLSTIERELKRGFSGDDVKQMQEALNGLGYDLGNMGVDGIFGKDTLAALKAFQEANGLDISGVLDDKTLETLKKASSATTDLADSCNGLISSITELGGRELLIDTLKNAFNGFMSVTKPIKEAFREIFPPTTSEQLLNIIQGLNNFSKRLTLSTETADKVKHTFKGFFAILDIGKQALSTLWNAVKPLVGGLGSLGSDILGVTASWGDWLVNLSDTIRETDVFNTVLQKLKDLIVGSFSDIKNLVTPVAETIKKFVTSIKENFKMPGFELFHAVLERVNTRMEDVGETVGSMKNGVVTAANVMGEALANSKFFKAMQSVWDAVKKISGFVLEGLGTLTNGIVDKIGNADFSSLFDIIGGLSIGGIALSIDKFLNSLTQPLEGLQGIIDGITGILDGVRGCFEAYQTQLKAGTLLKIASAIAILTASILVISLIDSVKLVESLGAITGLFTELMASMAIFGKISGSLTGTTMACGAMIAMSTAILMLASAMKSLSKLNWEELAKGLLGVAGLSGVIVASAKIMASGTGRLVKGASSLVIFSLAIKVLASTCKSLSTLNWEELAKGLVGVGVLLGEVSLFLNTAKFSGKAIGTATGILILSGAIKVLASACKDFGSMSWSEIGKGLAGVGVILLELATFTKLTANTKHVISTGVGLIAVAAAMKIFASAVSDFGTLSWEEIGKGLLAMGVALVEVAVAANFIPKNMMGIGTGLLIMGAALNVVAGALGKMGDMSWEEMGKSLLTMGAALTELAIALNFMNGTLSGSAALLVASAALTVLAPVLSLLGAMSWKSIAKSLITLAGAFAIVGVAGLVLTPIIPAILGLAGAIALIGVGVLGLGAGLIAAGTGLSALAIGFTALAAAGATGATAVIAALTVIITGVAGVIPVIATKIGEGIVAFCDAIITGAPKICDAFAVVLTSAVTALVEAIPMVVDGVVILITSILTTLAEYTPTVVQTTFNILLACLRGIADNISLIVQTGIDVVLGFIDGIAQKLPEVIQSGFDLLLSFINGITQAINTNTPLLVEAMNNLILALVDAGITVLTGGVDLFKKASQKIMDSGIVQGIKNKANVVKTAVSDLITNAKEAIGNKINEWKTAGKDLIDGFLQGIKDKASDAVNAAKGVVSDALQGAKNLLGIASPSKEFAKVGKWSDEGLVVGFQSYAGKVVTAAKDVGSSALDAMSNAISGIANIVDSDMDITPTIRPVVDLTAASNGVVALNGLFANSHGMALGTNISFGFGNRTSTLADMISSTLDNGNVVGAINELRNDVMDLATAMSKMKIVMDTGATVGALESEMDKRLGIRTGLKGRRN